ncbi:MAG: histidine-type phosphatase [Prevotella sp.]|nr:histidine-type phosphatase [Prevotella sp.]
MDTRNRHLLWPALLAALLLMISSAACAQYAFDEISRNRNISASNYCVYPDSVSSQLTPPPAGKHPFYISHYGRHGSRYLSNRKGYDIPYRMLCRADSMRQLTALGKEVLHQMRDIIDDSEGRWGDLTGIGKRQHRGIASRMYERFPEVFSGPDAYIEARSTLVPRCQMSMGAAVQQLVALCPQLKVDMQSSFSDMWYMNYQDKQLRDSMMTARAKRAYDAFSKPREGNSRLMRLLFVNPDSVKKVVSERWLNYYLLKTALIQQNTHMEEKNRLTDLFSYEEILSYWQSENAWWYIMYGPSPLNGGKQPFTQRYLLRHIIDEADSCIHLPQHGASLRFGHETVVLPLTCLLGINNFDYQTVDLDELELHGWWACLVFPMSSNIQFVFYRSDVTDDDIVFKVLLNENEATLPLKTDIAPYYHWRDFREYYLKKLDDYEKLRHTSASVSP